MKRILIKGAGGVAGIGMTRCLEKDYDVFGDDDSLWSKKLMTAIPNDGGKYDLIIPVADSMVGNLDPWWKPVIMPTNQDILVCQDKATCAKVLGDLAPKTHWIRDTHGAGGKGAQMCSEYLPGENYSCELAFVNGELIGSFVKHRLSYSVVDKDAPMDRRGSSMVSCCETQPIIVQKAMKALTKVSLNPNGAYGIDFKCNEEGEPLITEINPGRFLTASYVYFYMTDYNLPLAMVKAYFGEPYQLGKYPEGETIIRAVDSKPWIGKI